MLSTDLENLAVALEQVSVKINDENSVFFKIFCNNLLSLAQQVYCLETTVVVPNETVKKRMPLQ